MQESEINISFRTKSRRGKNKREREKKKEIKVFSIRTQKKKIHKEGIIRDPFYTCHITKLHSLPRGFFEGREGRGLTRVERSIRGHEASYARFHVQFQNREYIYAKLSLFINSCGDRVLASFIFHPRLSRKLKDFLAHS